MGAALGLMLVCIVDFVYPPKKLQRQSFSESKENSRNEIEDIANDEIEDDRPQNDEDGEDDEEAVDEDEDDDNEVASTDEDKQTHSESEEPESEKTAEKKQSDDKPSPGEVRKRKPRKAD